METETAGELGRSPLCSIYSLVRLRRSQHTLVTSTPRVLELFLTLGTHGTGLLCPFYTDNKVISCESGFRVAKAYLLR